MQKWVRTYCGPIIGGLMLLILAIIWIIDTKTIEKESTRALLNKCVLAVKSNIHLSLVDVEEPNLNALREELTRLVNVVPNLRFICVVEDGKVLCWVGEREPSGGAVSEATSLMNDDVILHDCPLEHRGRKLKIGLESRQFNQYWSEQRAKSYWQFCMANLATLILLFGWGKSIHSRQIALKEIRKREEREYLEELGQTANGLSHGTRNPLGIISGMAQRMAKNPTDTKGVAELATKIQDAVDDAAARLGDFVSYSKLKNPKITKITAKELVTLLCTVFADDFNSANVKLQTEVDETTLVGNKNMIRQVLVNLVRNSLQACSAGDEVIISIKCEGHLSKISVRDSGCGMSDSLLAKVLKPYVAGDNRGQGLGLAIVERIAHLHHWQVDVKSELGKGTEVTIGNVASVA